MSSRYKLYLNALIRQGWVTLRLAVKKFFKIDGAQWAGSFAFHGFFSLFPLMLLLVTVATMFIDQDQATIKIIAYVETYVPISEVMQSRILKAITGVINARAKTGVVAFVLLNWTALHLFTTLISATNRAWGVVEYSWWQQPLKSLLLLWITVALVLLGTGALILVQMAKDWLFSMNEPRFSVYALGSFFIPLLVVFFGLSLFYRLAPRRQTRFSEVWIAALFTTLLLLMAEGLFVIYLKHFAMLNAVYGALGGIMALLLWIYISGGILIFGACLCAAKE